MVERGIMQKNTILLTLLSFLSIPLFVGCETTPERKALLEHCRTAIMDMRCAKPKVIDTSDMVEVCERRGGGKDPRDCYWVKRSSIGLC